jgi:hypothetical protein
MSTLPAHMRALFSHGPARPTVLNTATRARSGSVTKPPVAPNIHSSSSLPQHMRERFGRAIGQPPQTPVTPNPATPNPATPNPATNPYIERARAHFFGPQNSSRREARKTTRLDWDTPVYKEKMDNALRRCIRASADGSAARSNKQREGQQKICDEEGVPRRTLRDRLRSTNPFVTPAKGRPGLFKREDRNAIVDMVAALDHLNNGKADSEIVDMLADFHPEFTRDQMRNTWRNTIKPAGGHLRDYVTQNSDKDRSGAITEVSQRFYFNLVGEAMAEAERLSGPDEDADGPMRTLWREKVAHLVFNLDEAGHMASTGNKKVVGDVKKKKHEKNNADSRLSITAVECGNAAGEDGPSIYLMAGAEMPSVFKKQYGCSKWLHRSGAPPNSFVVMTPNAFMTNAAWDGAAERLATGMRALPSIKDHPTLWLVLHLDGFKSHVMTYEAQAIFRKHRILVVKENSHSSQVNQVFDKVHARIAYIPAQMYAQARIREIYVCARSPHIDNMQYARFHACRIVRSMRKPRIGGGCHSSEITSILCEPSTSGLSSWPS